MNLKEENKTDDNKDISERCENDIFDQTQKNDSNSEGLSKNIITEYSY